MRRPIKLTIALLIAAYLMLAVLTGCHGGEEGSVPSSAPTPPASESLSPPTEQSIPEEDGPLLITTSGRHVALV